jgi:hypothetical protein
LRGQPSIQANLPRLSEWLPIVLYQVEADYGANGRTGGAEQSCDDGPKVVA